MNFRYHDLIGALQSLSPDRLALAAGLALAAYLVLAGYDAIALHAIRRRIPLPKIGFSSFIAYAMSQTLGFPLLTGGTIRYRFWTSWGLTTAEIAAAMSYVAATFVVGLLAVTSLGLILEPASTNLLLGMPPGSLRLIGFVGLAPVVAYLVWSARRPRPFRIRGWELPVPSFPLALTQLAVAAVDWSLAALVAYVLLPPAAGLSFPVVLGAFLVAQFAGIVTHIPGGLGVFDGLMVLFLSPYLDASTVLASLLAFRAAYYLVPFGLGLVLLIGSEVSRERNRLAALARHAARAVQVVTGRWIPAALPYLLGWATVLAGLILLVSGATPAVTSRIRFLDHLLPLGVMELSHFLASLVGGVLIVIGWALTRRLDAGYRVAQVLLGVGAVTSLLKGLDWEEALALSVVFLALLPARPAFYRRSAILDEAMSPGWVATIVAAIGFTVWLGLFSYRHVEYSSDLWWRFALTGDAPRFLRAMVGTGAVVVLFGVTRLLRHAPAAPALPTATDLDQAGAIVGHARQSSAALALLGDKALWFSHSGRGMLMYAVSGRSWVAMGDPIGAPEDQRELAWRFRVEADRHGARTVFYEVGTEALPLYLDLGLTLFKLGEEALVPLETFSLEGSPRRGLRRTHRELLEQHAAFEVVPAADVPTLLPELRSVSDEWLSGKRTREKGFSMGRFDEAYLGRFPVALVRIAGRLVAFATVWAAPAGGELSIDLMRYRAAPERVMEFLFIELMLWGRANGYRTFNLGMAPLSGLESRALAPLWTRAGALLYRHGEHFYNFQGIRRYKEKFRPEWRPRYLASPGGWVLPGTLANVAALISGGLRGVVAR